MCSDKGRIHIHDEVVEYCCQAENYSTLHEIPTVINVLVVSRVEDNKLFSNPSISRTCKTSAAKPENKDHKSSL